MNHPQATMLLLMLVMAASLSDFCCQARFAHKRPGRFLINLHRRQLSHLEFGGLDGVDVDYGSFESRPIDLIKEDKYRRGTFFFTQGSALMRYTPGKPISVVLGSTEFVRPFQFKDGTSKEARFSLIGDIVQYNQTKMAISDFVNNCVREYDFDTDMVTTLIGECGQQLNTGSLEPGVIVNGSTKFLSGPTNMEYIEATRSLIVLDFGYKQIAKYDFDTHTAQLLGDSLFEQMPNTISILLNSEDTKLYVAHSYGVSVVNMATMEVTILVGETVHDRGFSNRPLLAGSFRQASIGKVESLTWLVQDQVLVAVRAEHTEALVTMDLVSKSVSTQCVGNDDSLVTVTGNASSCSLNAPTAVAAVNNTVYLGTLAKGNYDSYKFDSDSLWFKTEATQNFCTLENKSQYQKMRPRRERYAINRAVRVWCSGNRVQTLTCLSGPSGSAKWNQAIPEC